MFNMFILSKLISAINIYLAIKTSTERNLSQKEDMKIEVRTSA